MYARGLSTRDIEDAFRDRETGKKLLAKSQASQICHSLMEEYEAFAKRDLSSLDVVYLFLDAVYEPLRRTGRSGPQCLDTKSGLLKLQSLLSDLCIRLWMRVAYP